MADGLTRSLIGSEYRKFVNLLGMKGKGEGNSDNEGRVDAETMGMPGGE